MTIHLPDELHSSIRAEVLSGHFASDDDAVTAIVREHFRRKAAAEANAVKAVGADPLLGSMREFADDMDEIVADAYRRRSEDQGRKFDL
jgi:Arc/MetJ-type ribon-helix-helix transcriptional regulator